MASLTDGTKAGTITSGTTPLGTTPAGFQPITGSDGVAKLPTLPVVGTGSSYSSEKGQTLVETAKNDLSKIQYGDQVTDSMGRTGTAMYDAKTGKPLVNPNAKTNGTTPTSTTQTGTPDTTKTGGGLTVAEVAQLGGNISDYKLNTDGTYSPKPKLSDNEQRVADAKAEYDKYTTMLQQMGLASADTSGIAASWDARIKDMEASNNSRQAALRQTGIRSGSQYTGGAGGVWGSILSGEEIAGIGRIKDLQTQKLAAIMDAKNAAETQNWGRMVKLADIAKTKYTDQQDALKKLNEATAEQDRKLKIETAISNAYSSGITDPSKLFSLLAKGGVAVTTKDIKDFIDNVKPDQKALGDLLTTMRNNGADDNSIKSVSDAYNNGGNLTDAYLKAGKYAASGSGIVGEYNYAKANGYTGTFSDYQNEDANRKLRVTTGGGLSPTILTKVQGIAGQFDNEQVVKDYNTAATQVSYINTLGDKPTDDIARVYAFAKVMDPNSVVREGEYKTVQDYAQAVMQSAGLKAQRVFTNTGFLTDEARTFMQNTLAARLKTQEKTFKNVYDEYGRRINKISGQNDGTDYLTDYSKGYTTADSIINSDKQMTERIASWVTEAPENRQRYYDAKANFPDATPAELKDVLQIP